MRVLARLAPLAPFALYVAAIAVLGAWIIDDAGIAFAYARSVARGDGFVSQPGRPPVEGFSDFLWVLALVPFFVARLFHPIVVPKLLGATCVLGSFAILQRALRRITGSPWPGVVTAILLAVSPPIVVWSASGLENGLLLLLLVALFARAAEGRERWARACGVLTALVAMTRPEGVVYVVLGLLVCLAEALREPEGARIRRVLRAGGEYLAAFAALFVPFLGFRLAVFGRPFPHPYYAKRVYVSAGEHLRDIARHPDLLGAKLAGLSRGIAGGFGPWLLGATGGALVYLIARRRFPRSVVAAAAIQIVSLGAFLWMDDDWMGECRFGTGAVFASLLTAVLAGDLVLREALSARRSLAAVACGAAACLGALAAGAPRIVRFAEAPPTPYLDVDRQYARRYSAYADLLGLARGSIFVADAGATVMDSRLTVYDAAGLFEPDLVRTLKHDTQYWLFDHPDFYDWVFTSIRPTFIVTRGFWTYVTAFERDPRFARDYAAIDAFDDAYVRRVYGVSLRSGDFVRRDAVPAPGDLDRLRSQYRAPPRPEPFAFRIEAALGAGGAPSRMTEDELKSEGEARAVFDPQRAVALFTELASRRPDDVVAAGELASSLDAAGRTDEARIAWAAVLPLARMHGDLARAASAAARLAGPDDPGAGDAERDRLMMQEGLDALYASGAPERAVGVFRRVLALHPGHYGATYQLAVALERAGRADEARIAWAAVVPLAERFGDLATLALARGKVEPGLTPR